MQRLTEKLADGSYTVAETLQEEALQKLAKYENFHDALQTQQQELTQKLEALRAEGKKNSVQFREALGNKVMATNTLALLRVHGIE